MFYCKNCLYPSTKPDLWFSDEGICAACLCFESRKTYNFNAARKNFIEILKKNKKNPKYDCIVPVSGGKDSTYQVWKVLQSGFNPLCVTAPTDFLTPIGRRNIENLKNLGADYIEISVNRDTRKKIARHSLFTVGDIQWAEHVLIYTAPVRIAVNFEIPVIIWGECPQREYGAGRPEDAKIVYFDRRILEEYGSLNNQRVSDLLLIDGVQAKDLYFYEYPEGKEISNLGLLGIYLDNYFEWHGISNAIISQSLGFEVSSHFIPGSISNFENLDNYVHGIHDYFKYLKFGFSRATDVACNYIRRKILTREDAIEIVKLSDGAFPSRYLDKSLLEILNYFKITQEEFSKACDDFTNYNLFKSQNNNKLQTKANGAAILKASFNDFKNI